MKLAVSIGCPSGIGPEVAVVAAASLRGARALLVGDLGVVRRAARGRGIDASRVVAVEDPDAKVGARSIAVWQPGAALRARDCVLGQPSRAGGAAQLAWVDAACDLAARGGAAALVTGPVSKDAIAHSGAPGARRFLGHTEHLQRRLGAREVVMAFWSERLTTALCTTHLPIARVPSAVTRKSVGAAAYWLAVLLSRTCGGAPRVAVASLNPHAGEGGLLGREEAARIVPGIGLAARRLHDARIKARLFGPVPAETAFRLAVGGEYDGVVAMFHDQATIPMKLLAFGTAVNVSLGLPIVRTSVDHGTAYDRAARFDADPRGMKHAMHLATRLAPVN